MVGDLGEGGCPATGRGQVAAGGAGQRDRAALAAAAAEVDRDERNSRGPGPGNRIRGGRADEAGQRPAVGGNEWVVTAGAGKEWRAADPSGDRRPDVAAAVETPRRRRGDAGQQQERQEADQADLLDARGAALGAGRGPLVHAAP